MMTQFPTIARTNSSNIKVICGCGRQQQITFAIIIVIPSLPFFSLPLEPLLVVVPVLLIIAASKRVLGISRNGALKSQIIHTLPFAIISAGSIV